MIALKDISFRYTRQEQLFHQLNLNLENNGICGLLGKNGAGKTTLLKIIAGLAFADEGTTQVLGHIPRKRHPNFLSEIYFLPEDFFVPALTAEQYENFYASFYPRFDHTLFLNNLAELELPHKKLLTQFSQGQKKKFMIAFALATHCSLIIFDEPTNGLDIPSKTQFRKLLAATIAENRLFIISTHQVHDVEKLIDRVIILDQGKIIYQQTLVEEETRIDLEELFNKVINETVKSSAAGANHEYA